LKDTFVEVEKSNLHHMELVTKLQQKVEDYELGIDGILLYRSRFYVPKSSELRSVILK
jgi:hypothetical protein